MGIVLGPKIQFPLNSGCERRLPKANENGVHSSMHCWKLRGKGKGAVEGMGVGRERMNEGLKGDARCMRIVLGP